MLRIKILFSVCVHAMDAQCMDHVLYWLNCTCDNFGGKPTRLLRGKQGLWWCSVGHMEIGANVCGMLIYCTPTAKCTPPFL